MSETAIRVENLSKQFRLGEKKERYKTLRDSLSDAVAAPFRKMGRRQAPKGADFANGDQTFWALRDVSFEVKRGEVVGVIGHNGAGKSTLLKILSRITEPTDGFAEIRGRVGSLLEVGTGFHPELTGRENVFLNGAILGMHREEIERKFDEIVAFAEVEKFIDTPVKRYSSGMYLRLAFAVAAHLELDILMVDEVLAVGDAAFQKKCLGKMEDVTKQGRTVLFVSHNMQAIQALAGTAIHLSRGQLVQYADSTTVVTRYLAGIGDHGCEVWWPEDSAPGNADFKLTGMRVYDENSNNSGMFLSSQSLCIEMRFIANSKHSALCVGFDLAASTGEIIARSYQTDLHPDQWPQLKLGENIWRCIIPRGLLNSGMFYVMPRIGLHNIAWIVTMEAALQFEVILDHGVSPFWNSLTGKKRPGVIAPILDWEAES